MTLVYLGVNENSFNDKPYAKVNATNQYEIARYKGEGVTMILYTSGKLVVQGSEENLEVFKQNNSKLNLQEPKQKKEIQKVNIPISDEYIGSDETLKGDTFGGMIVVGAYFRKEEEDNLKRMGVVDSKQLTDLQIIRIAENLLEYYSDRFAIQELEPKEYNEIIPQTPLTKILDKMHIQVGLKLKQQHPKALHIVDQYPGCAAGDFMMQKAETHSIQVAAASIVARKIGLDQFEMLSEKAGFILPKGSTHVEEALEKIKEKGLLLNEFVKIHFKNVKMFM